MISQPSKERSVEMERERETEGKDGARARETWSLEVLSLADTTNIDIIH